MPSHLKSLFGPVPSRRLGRSLGIDVIPPKTCTYDCVYCESGRTTVLTIHRQEFTTDDRVLGDLRRFFQQHPGGADVLTFSSAGEPTLHLGLGRLIERIKQAYPSLPLVVLTNGSLLWDPDVRQALLPADRVVPSLDAATLDLFRKVDRPHPSLDFSAILEGLYAFGREYQGELHIEVLLVRGMNDAPHELQALRREIDRIKPLCVELNTVVRPPTCPHLRGLNRKEMTAAARYFPPDKTHVIGRFEAASRHGGETEALEDRVLQLVTRRPCCAEEMADSLGVSMEALQKTLARLEHQKRVKPQHHDDRLYYCPTPRS